MNEHDFRTTITVDATPRQVYDAINDVRAWWSHDVDGATDTVGGEFAYGGWDAGRNVHRARIRVTELVPDERVVWHVVDNWMSFINDQEEWKDTHIVFEIAETTGGTELRFSHLGLVPSYECYDVCFNAWTFFITDSLRELITSGTGQPMAKGRAA